MSADRLTVNRPVLQGLLLALALVAALAPGRATAGKADAFEGKIRPVSGRLYSKAGRLELTPTANLSLNDAFFAKQLFGAKLGYNFSEQWGIAGSFALGRTTATGSTAVCPSGAGCGAASVVQLNQVPGAIERMAGGEIAFSPIYGKLNVLAERVLHFDLSILAGVDWITYREVLSDQASESLNGAEAPTTSTIGAHFGLGARIFLTRYMAVRAELKDYVYRVPIGNFSDRTDLQNQLFTEIGLSVFYPFHPAPRP